MNIFSVDNLAQLSAAEINNHLSRLQAMIASLEKSNSSALQALQAEIHEALAEAEDELTRRAATQAVARSNNGQSKPIRV